MKNSKNIKKPQPTPQQRLGLWGENFCIKWLRKRNYKIIQHRFTCREGEIDIIAKDKNQIVFIEVKTRTNQKFGLPEESVTKSKLERFEKTIWHWLEENDLQNADFRIDILALQINRNLKSIKIEYFKNILTDF